MVNKHASKRAVMGVGLSQKNNVTPLTRYYTLLRDPARRKIIEILGSQSKIGFKELRQELKLDVGQPFSSHRSFI